MLGTVIHLRIERGFAFIRPDNGDHDVFLHASTLGRAGIDFDETLMHRRLEFDVQVQHDGKSRAVNVKGV